MKSLLVESPNALRWCLDCEAAPLPRPSRAKWGYDEGTLPVILLTGKIIARLHRRACRIDYAT
jgi:hypothetical protein